ncbi:MAG: glycosyltransferase family 4 protein [Phycisphaerales bacterium]|nr:glycosyltransferase family 4 protein [Phycisphaerales bacterium]
MDRWRMADMRWAFVTPEFVTELKDSGGLATYLYRISRALIDIGHEVEVFTLSEHPPGRLVHDGMLVHRVGRKRNRALYWAFRLTRLHWRLYEYYLEARTHLEGPAALATALAAREAEKPFDVVQASEYGQASAFIRKRRHRPLLVRCSGATDLYNQADQLAINADQRLLKRIERWTIRRADLAYAPSQLVADYYRAKYGLNVGVIRPPMFRETSTQVEPPVDLPNKFLFHYGLLGQRKGTLWLSRALPLAWKQCPELQVILAGQLHHPYEAMKELSKQWQDNNGRIRWLGPLPKAQLYAVLKRAWATVLPSEVDNLPNTVIESLMHGKPVIGTYGASINELVEDGCTGGLVPLGNDQALADMMVRAWHGQPPFDGKPIPEPVIFKQMQPAIAAKTLTEAAQAQLPQRLRLRHQAIAPQAHHATNV